MADLLADLLADPFHPRRPGWLREIRCLAWALLLPATFVPQGRAAPAPSSPVAATMGLTLAVLADGSTPQGSRHDFGPITTVNTPRLEHTFTVRNAGTGALTVTRLQPSCGCTSAVLAGAGRLPVTLKPGQQIPIQVSINLEAGLAGPFRKTVSVFVAEQAAPAAVLELLATLNALVVTATPAVLNFGQASYGKAVSLPFTLHARNGSAPALLAASLACSSPDVSLRLLPPTPKDEPGTLRGVATLSAQAGLGPLQGEVLVLSPAGDVVPLAALPIQGTVLGNITAAPASLSWGASAGARSPSEAHSQPPTRQIILKAQRPGALRGLQFSCASRAFRVHLDAVSPAGAVLSVVLTAPVKRSLTSRVLVTTASGQCLQIPLLVAAPTAP